MASKGRLEKSNSLSLSLPNVSSSNHHQPSVTNHFQFEQLSPVPDTPFISSPNRTVNTQYNIDDDAWADKADHVTGSVFYVQPNVTSHSNLIASSSSSSLSSSPPMSEQFYPPPSPTTAYSLSSLPERFSSSVQLPPSPRSLDEHGSFSPLHRNSGSFRSEKPSSIRKKLQGITKKRKGHHEVLQTGSLSDLNKLSQLSDSSPPIPQGSQYGSHGIPLSMPVTSPFMSRVELDLSQFNLAAKTATPCSLERLGIIPSGLLSSKGKFGSLASLRFSFRTHYPSPTTTHNPVVIRNIVSGSPAATTQMKSGDTILAVDQQPVHMDNIDAVLVSLSNRVCFTIEKARSRFLSLTDSSPAPHPPAYGGLVRLVMGQPKRHHHHHHHHHHKHLHMLLYITLDTKEDDPIDKDILFQYPRLSEDEGDGTTSSSLKQLVKLRGVFLTLGDTLSSITGSFSVCNSSVVLDGQLVRLSGSQRGKELLLIALPAELASPYQLQLLLENIAQTMQLIFSSVHRAFTNASHSAAVEHILELVFDMALSDSGPAPSSSLFGVPAVPRLKLPTDVRIKLDAMLSELESANHNDRPEILHLRRPFLLVGSCLMYKGVLACNHLSSSDLREVILYCHSYRLLELTATESVSQIVIWKEIFPSSVLSARDEEDLVYSVSQQDLRAFLLVIGLEQMLLCMLMQQSSRCLPQHGQPPNVDAIYVDRGRSLLLELKTQDLFHHDDNHSLLPSLLSADMALASRFNRSSSKHSISASQHSSPFLSGKRKLSDLSDFKSSLAMKFGSSTDVSAAGGGGGGDDGSDSDGETPDGTGSGGGGSKKIHRRSHSMLQLKPNFRHRKMTIRSTDSFSGKVQAIKTPCPPYTLTSGMDNLLLHYISLEPGRGLMLCPTHSPPSGVFHLELLQCFHQTCSKMRSLLRGTRRERKKMTPGDVVDGELSSDSSSDDDDDWDNEDELDHGKHSAARKPFADRTSHLMECGMLLECSTKSFKTTAVLHYWVIGRYFSEVDRELYICCQENTSQSTVEMAFKLLFGWPEY